MPDRELHILVLADDLTGAAEIGGLAFQHGLTARIVHSPGAKRSLPEEVTIIDTGSRGSEPEQAYRLIRELISGHSLSGYDLVYKKVDSALRGPVVAEIKALFTSPDFDKALMIPANPSRKRIIRGGRYFIDGVPVNETEFRLDPLHPRLYSGICELCDGEGWVVTGKDPAALKEGMIFVPDIESEKDISDRLSNICPPGVLLAGGSDFFRTILWDRLHLSPVPHPVSGLHSENHLLISGSRSENSRITAIRLRSLDYYVYELPVRAIREESFFLEWTRKIRKVMRKEGKLMITGPIAHVNEPQAAGRISGKLARAAKMLAENVSPDTHLYMEGGETASEFFRIMGWDQLVIRKVLDTGVVTLQHEHADLKVTVKPGSYSWPENLLG